MKKAIIYVRGHNQETQEISCRLYAEDKGYKVLFVTTDIKTVNNCDVLIVAKPSRISRNSFTYYETVNKLKANGIEIEFATNNDYAVNHHRFAENFLK